MTESTINCEKWTIYLLLLIFTRYFIIAAGKSNLNPTKIIDYLIVISMALWYKQQNIRRTQRALPSKQSSHKLRETETTSMAPAWVTTPGPLNIGYGCWRGVFVKLLTVWAGISQKHLPILGTLFPYWVILCCLSMTAFNLS